MSDDLLRTSSATDNTRISKPVHSHSLSSNSASTLNPRSCVTCRRRKVKCDKKQPCSNCARAKIECIFPGPGRAPRKSRKPPDGELMDRLRRLEGVVQSLNAQVEEHEQEAVERERRSGSGDSGAGEGAEDSCPNKRRDVDSASVVVDDSVQGLETRFGRLVVDQGRSRYINNSFWASLNNEVEDLKSILIEHSDDEDTQDSPGSNSSQHNGFIFGYSSNNVDMLALHPPMEQALEYWALYKQNVDPLIKVLHIPTFEPTLFAALAHPENIQKSLEPLIFSIYYGAVTSMPSEDCVARWGETRQELLNKYRFGLEQGLARANFLFCDEMIILQAFIIFMILLRRNDDARKIWTLTGLAVRIAQTLGIHRDGSHFNLKPFEVEMRRRLWWQVCILDARASEDHGCDPTIIEAQYDTKMPLNVNDSDIDPDMKEFPEERTGFTDTTFCLIRYEVTNIFRRILYVPPGPNRCNQFFSSLTVPQKERWISDCHQRLEDKYLKNCDMSIPLCWITATISRLVMSKMWLIVYHPHQRKDGGASLPQETKDKLFITSLENIEYSVLIETEARTMQWGWLFRTYVQWHAIAFLLSELCIRTKGEAVERAWRALDNISSRWWNPLPESASYNKGTVGCLWRPLRKLMTKARTAREREVALERASQALKNSGIYYADFASMLDQLPGGEAPPVDQPSPENLDRMLRPVAPTLGQMPVASPPTWNKESPNMSNIQFLQDTWRSSGSASPTTATNDRSGTGVNRNGNDGSSRQMTHVEAFNSLSEHGLDYLFGDVMDGYIPPSSSSATTISSIYPQNTNSKTNNNSPTTNLVHNTTNTDPAALENITQQPPLHLSQDATNPNYSLNLEVGGGGIGASTSNANTESSAQSSLTYSPVLDSMLDSSGSGLGSGNVGGGDEFGKDMGGELGTEMDWAVWDDLVNQYGMDGVVQQAQGQQSGINGMGHLGKVGWF